MSLTPEQIALYEALTELQQAFANALIAAPESMSHGEAYLIACQVVGHTPAKDARSAGNTLAVNPNVVAYIESIKGHASKERAEGAIASRDEVLEFLTDCMRCPAMMHIPDPAALSERERRSFAGIEWTKYGPKIKQHSQFEAARAIADIEGFKVTKAPVGPDGEPVGPETVLVFDPDLYAAARAKILDDL